MITTTSLLDYLEKEDSLMKESDRNSERKVSLLNYINNSDEYPRALNIPKDELPKYKNEVIVLEKREDKIREELMKVRASMRR